MEVTNDFSFLSVVISAKSETDIVLLPFVVGRNFLIAIFFPSFTSYMDLSFEKLKFFTVFGKLYNRFFAIWAISTISSHSLEFTFKIHCVHFVDFHVKCYFHCLFYFR